MAKINFENFGRDLLYNFTGRPKEGPGAGGEADQWAIIFITPKKNHRRKKIKFQKILSDLEKCETFKNVEQNPAIRSQNIPLTIYPFFLEFLRILQDPESGLVNDLTRSYAQQRRFSEF